MAHHYQKKWVFTWNANKENKIISSFELQCILNEFVSEAVFQLEKGKETGRLHYQGRLVLKGPRQGKAKVLELFNRGQGRFCIEQLTVSPEIVYDSTSYCTKSETRVDGPWYAGLESYTAQHSFGYLKMKDWQDDFLDIISEPNRFEMKNRKVIWIEDRKGGAGKSEFIKWLAVTKPDELEAEKLPFDQPDRTRAAVVKLMKQKDIDLFMFDFTRTRGVNTDVRDLFEAIEEIKNGYVIDTMYGKFQKVIYFGVMVVIFTNEDHQDYMHYLSEDRWEPYSIVQGSLNRIFYEDGSKMFMPYKAWKKEQQKNNVITTGNDYDRNSKKKKRQK